MPIHLLVLFLLFIMSNLFYRGGGGGRAGSNLSILKEAKKNMGQFIFSRGGGWESICLFLCQKIHNTSVGKFNIILITISL